MATNVLNVPLRLVTMSNIDGKTTANTTLYTQDSTEGRLYPLLFIVSADDISGFSVGPTISFGTTATATELVAATVISVADQGTYTMLTPKTTASNVASTLIVKVSVAATATTYKFRVYTLGIVIPDGPE